MWYLNKIININLEKEATNNWNINILEGIENEDQDKVKRTNFDTTSTRKTNLIDVKDP